MATSCSPNERPSCPSGAFFLRLAFPLRPAWHLLLACFVGRFVWNCRIVVSLTLSQPQVSSSASFVRGGILACCAGSVWCRPARFASTALVCWRGREKGRKCCRARLVLMRAEISQRAASLQPPARRRDNQTACFFVGLHLRLGLVGRLGSRWPAAFRHQKVGGRKGGRPATPAGRAALPRLRASSAKSVAGAAAHKSQLLFRRPTSQPTSQPAS